MVYHSKSFKASAWLLALSLATGGTVSAAQAAVPYDTVSPVNAAASAASTPFADVKAGHWAEKHIAKLALQGIIIGNNGQFRPADSVSRQEAIVMAIRFAGLEGEVDRDEAVVFPTSFQVDKYFIPYVVLAFEKGLIDQNEQFGIADKEAGSPWGSSKASREWVTKLIVNAIGKSADAKAQAGKPMSFVDAASVGEGYGGYINTAVALNLVNGVAGNKFDPKGIVNRAMMATLLSRAEPQFPVQYAGQTEGIIASAGNGAIALYTSSGVQTYATGADTLYSHTGSEQFMAGSGLIPYARAFVIAKDGKALYVEQVNDEQKVETISGTFDRFVPASRKMWVWVGDTPTEIVYDDTLQIKDKDGNAIAASALTKDANVKVVRDTFRSSPIAISVQVVDSPNASVNKTGNGTVKTVGASTITIASGGVDETWNVAAGAIFVNGNTLLKSLQDIKPGDKVTYEVKNNVVERIDVSGAAVQLTDSGIYYRSDSSTITYMKDKKYITKPVIDSTVVNIEGLPSAALTDLQLNDQLVLSLNESDQVTKIAVTNRKVELAAGVEILDYSSKYGVLSVVDGKGEFRSLKFGANSQIDFNGVPFTLDAAVAGGLLTKGRKITVSYTGDTIVQVQLSYRYSGTVVSVNSSTSKLTLSVGGNLLTLTMQNPLVEVYGKSTATLADVLTGSDVIAMMNQDQDKVNGIYVVSKRQMTVVSANPSTNRVTLREGSTGTSEYSVSGLELLDDAGNKLALSSLQANSVVNVQFQGKTPIRIQRVAVTVGAVRTVDGTQVIVSDYNGRTTSIPLGSKYTIIRNGGSSNSYSALQAGDRVEVRKDADDNVVATVLKSEQKKFWKYDAATNTLQTKRTVITDQYQYVLNGVTLTSGGSAITVQSIAEDSLLVLYYYDNKLIEIEKR